MENQETSVSRTHSGPFVVADWQVDPASNRITRGSETVNLEPKAMQVLVYLASKPEQVVTREELESEVWAGTVVGYDALSNAIIKLRKALGDKARDPRIIETIFKTGYRLRVHVDAVESESVKQRTVTLELPSEPSIAVLAFDNMSGDPKQDYFSDGVTEDIITDLSKISGLFVIARNSSFAYKGKQINLQEVSRELGVRYILEGSVRKAGNRVRISAQMVDSTTGGHIWAERYDRNLTDIFAVQAEVTQNIVAALAPTLSATEQQRPGYRATSSLEAYDYFLKGREQTLRDSAESNAQAGLLLRKAIELDPQFSSGHSHLGRNYILSYVNRWGDPADQSLQLALACGRKAVALDERNPHAHFAVAAAALWANQHELAVLEAERAITINPNFSEGHEVRGLILTYIGQPAEAIVSMETAMRLDPHYRDVYLHVLALAYFHSQQYENAVRALKRRLIRRPESDVSRFLLAATYGHLSQPVKSRAEWGEILHVNPQFSLEHRRKIVPYKYPEDFEQIVDGLRKGGLRV